MSSEPLTCHVNSKDIQALVTAIKDGYFAQLKSLNFNDSLMNDVTKDLLKQSVETAKTDGKLSKNFELNI